MQVKIVWDGIDRRITQLTHMPGSVMYVVPAPDSRTYLFSAQGAAAEDPGAGAGGGPGMYTDRRRRHADDAAQYDVGRCWGGGARWTRRSGGGGGFNEPQWARDSRSIYFLQGGGLYSLGGRRRSGGGYRGGAGGSHRADAADAVDAAARRRRHPSDTASAGAAPRRINFSVKMEIDIPAERRQVFEEAWRVMKNRFYDAKMHGVNWAAAKDKYEAMLPHIADSEELHNLIMEMIGDLNASHTGITGGSRLPAQGPPEERIATRYPGFDIEPDASGFYKVSYIYRKGPADHDYVKIAPGNFVLAVNGKELKTSRELLAAVQHSAGAKVRVPGELQALHGWRVDHQPGAADRRGDEHAAIRPLGGRSQTDGRQADQRRNRLPAHQGDGRAFARQVPARPAGEPGQEGADHRPAVQRRRRHRSGTAGRS